MSNAASSPIVVDARPSASLVSWTQVIYALHAFSLLTGILGAATVVGAFLTGWPSIIAVILNYVKRGEARGTWLESHFRWQIRTFWFGLLWVSLCLAVRRHDARHRHPDRLAAARRRHALVHLPHRARLDGAERPQADVHVALDAPSPDGIGEQCEAAAVAGHPAPLDLEPGLAEQPQHVRFVALDQPPVGQVLEFPVRNTWTDRQRPSRRSSRSARRPTHPRRDSRPASKGWPAPAGPPCCGAAAGRGTGEYDLIHGGR